MTPEQILQSSGQSFRPASGGGELVTTCPACGKEDHLYVNARMGAWNCKRCGKSGGLGDLAELLGVDGGQRDLTDKAVQMNAALPPNLREWFRKRGIDSLIGLRRYGYDARRQRISIPYWQGDKVVDIRYRALPGSIEEQLNKEKYLTEEGGTARLYNLDSLKGRTHAILTEGEFDCDLLCAQELDNFAIVGCPGASSFKREWVRRFDKCEKVYIVFDPDAAGIAGADRVASLLGEKAIVVDLPEAWGDLTEAFTQHGVTTDEFIRRIYLSEEWRQVPASLRRAIPEEGFVRDFLDYALPLTDAPVEFLVAGAMLALATAAGNSVWFRGWGGLNVYPNLWIIIMAPPGFFRKSTVLYMVKDVIRRTSIGDRILPESWSREALFDVLKDNPSGTMFHSEFTAFTAMLSQEYMKGARDDLTALFEDPSPPARRTKLGGQIKLNNVSINILGATTLDWFLDSVKSVDIRGGFLTRFLFVPARQKIRHIALPPEPDGNQRNLLVQHLQAVAGQGEREMSLDGVKDAYSRWLVEHQKGMTNPDLQGFYTRLGTYIIKLAVLFELSFNPRSTVVSEKAWQYAERLTCWLRQSVVDLMEQELTFTGYEQKRKKVLKTVKEDPGIAHHVLMRKVRLDTRDLSNILVSLMEEQAIRVQQEPTKGRPLRRYYPV